MTKSPRKNVPDVGIKLGAACMPSELASNRATAPGQRYNMSHVMRKPVLPYANNKGADQHAHPRSLISAFVVRCLDSIITSISEISSICLTSVAIQAGLRQTPKTGLLVTKLICYCRTCFSMGDLGVQVSVRLSVFVNIYPGCLVSATPLIQCVPNGLNFCRCLRHGMRMCMWFGYSCYIIFCHFFRL